VPVSDERPANGAERPAIVAPRPANGDATTGNPRHDDRQSLPTNLSENSSLNTSLKCTYEGAAASGSTAHTFVNLKSAAARPDEPDDIREGKAAQFLQTTPDISADKLASMFRLPAKKALKLIQTHAKHERGART
jgi:hypothetical protein